VPTVPVAGGGPLVMVGAGVGGPAMVMLKFWVASGAVPLVAVTVPVKVPAVVGVPVIAPVSENAGVCDVERA
jgi:hypothetical protein